jgi:hypothetical protein
MADNQGHPTHLICLWDPRFGLDTLGTDPAAVGSFSEGGARPGTMTADDPLSRLIPVASFDQTQAIDLIVVNGGPARRNGVQLAYRVGSESLTTDYRGWAEPRYISAFGWLEVNAAATAVYDLLALAVVPSSQKVLGFYANKLLAAGTGLNVRTFDHATTVWSSAVLINNSPSKAIGAVVLPETERILVFQDLGSELRAEFSDDDGATWSLYSQNPISLANSGDGGGACMVGEDVLFVSQSGSDYSQAASDSLGTQFELIEEAATLGTGLQVFEIPGGAGAGMIYVDSGIKFRRIASAYQAISSAAEVTVRDSTNTPSAAAGTADHDGILYVHIRFTGKAQNECWRSTDLGDSWEEVGDWADTTAIFDNWAAPMISAPSAGWIVLLSNFTINGNTFDDSPGATWLAGWSNVYPDFGWGGVVGTTNHTCWIPIDTPDQVDAAWTAVGAVAGVIGNDGMTITTVAQDGYYSRTAGTANGVTAVQVQVQVHSGGSLASLTAGFRTFAVDATNESLIAFRMTPTTVRIYDVKAAGNVVADITLDTTTPTVWLVEQTTTRLDVWYRKPWDPKWTQAVNFVVIANAARTLTTSTLQIGSVAVGTAVQSFQFTGQADFTITAVDQDSTLFRGKALNSLPYPVPDVSPASAGRMTRLSVRAGPGRYDETFTISPEHDHPIEAAFALTGPSPDRRWRSADLTEQLIVWDLDSEAWVGDAVALFVAGANFRTATLEVWNGAAWVVVGTLDLAEGFASLEYVRATGCDAVTVAGVTSNADRWLQENEKAGGTIQLGGGVARRIRNHSAGGWTDDGTTVKPTITMDGADDTEPASGSCNLCSPNGILVVPLTAHTCRRYWAVRIPVQDVPDAYYEAGCLLPMRAYALGAVPDWEWSEEVSPNTQISRTTYGTPHARELGPPQKVRSWGWNSGTHLRFLRDDVEADYRGTTAGLPLVGREDVNWVLQGIQQRAKGGLYPCVLVAGAQDGTTVQTDPSLFLYGPADFAVSARSAAGTEGDTNGCAEVLRIDRISVRQTR